MKVIAELSQLGNGQNYPHLTAVDEDGTVLSEITMTLLDLIMELHPPADRALEQLFADVSAGLYVPAHPELADFSVNDKFIWVRNPEVELGRLKISNENVPEYSMDDGCPQIFSVDLYYSVKSHWLQFLSFVAKEGEQKWLGQKFEMEVILDN